MSRGRVMAAVFRFRQGPCQFNLGQGTRVNLPWRREQGASLFAPAMQFASELLFTNEASRHERKK
jgi:hypothetical protein